MSKCKARAVMDGRHGRGAYQSKPMERAVGEEGCIKPGIFCCKLIQSSSLPVGSLQGGAAPFPAAGPPAPRCRVHDLRAGAGGDPRGGRVARARPGARGGGGERRAGPGRGRPADAGGCGGIAVEAAGGEGLGGQGAGGGVAGEADGDAADGGGGDGPAGAAGEGRCGGGAARGTACGAGGRGEEVRGWGRGDGAVGWEMR